MLFASAAILSLGPIAIPLKKRFQLVLGALWTLLPPNAHKGAVYQQPFDICL